MDPIIPPLKDVGGPDYYADITNPSLLDTARAQWGKVGLDNIGRQTFMWTDPNFDSNSIAQGEAEIARRGLVGAEAERVRLFSVRNQSDIDFALDFNMRQRAYGEVIANSSGFALMLTAPDTAISIALPLAGAGIKAVTALLIKYAARAQAGRVAGGRTVLGDIVEGFGLTSRMTPEELAKYGAIDGAFSTGTVTLVDALDEISVGGEPLTLLMQAGQDTAMSTLFGGFAGFAFGSFLAPRTMNRSQAMAQVLRNQNESLNVGAAAGEVKVAGSWFTDSPLFKMFSTPSRRVLGSKELPDFVKADHLLLEGDGSTVMVHNQAGIPTPASVAMNSARRNSDWAEPLDIINSAYSEVAQRPQVSPAGVQISQYAEQTRKLLGREAYTLDDFYEEISDLYIRNVPYDQMTGAQAKGVQAIDSFFKKYEADLRAEGLIKDKEWFVDSYLREAGRQGDLMSITNSVIQQNLRWMDDTLERVQVKMRKGEVDYVDYLELKDKFEDYRILIEGAESVDDLAGLWNELDLTPRMSKALKKLGESIESQRTKLTKLKGHLDYLEGLRQDTPKGRYWHRIYDTDRIRKDRDTFKSILVRWFMDNPEISLRDKDGNWEIYKASTKPEAVEARAEETINRILGESEDDMVDRIITQGRHLSSRSLNMPDELIKDFLVTNTKAVMVSYSRRVAPRIEWAKAFKDSDMTLPDGKPNPRFGKSLTLAEYVAATERKMRGMGVSEEAMKKWRRDFTHTYDMVVGSARKRVDAWDTDLADGLKKITQMGFLKSSGIAALGDLSALFMDNELSTIGKGFLAVLDPSIRKMAKREANLSGEILEPLLGSLHARHLDDLTVNPLRRSTLDKASNLNMQLNLLGPATVTLKTLGSLLQGHTLIDAIRKVASGTASDWDVQWLSRFGIDKARAKRIAEMPYQEKNGLFLANTEDWTDLDAVTDFRNALSANIYNRIISATSADKPIAMSGVWYVPDNIAQFFPMELPLDPRVPGYRRLESGMLSLPFTLYSYTLGALSKITAQHAAGAVRNPMMHIAMSMGLAYTIVKLRTPEYVWNEMTNADKIARAFDFSGLAAVYTDIAYRTLGAAADAGFRDALPIAPKFYAEPDPLGAIFSLGGAPFDYTYEMLKATKDMVTGNPSDGAKRMIGIAPLIGALALQGVITDSAKALADQLPSEE